MLWTLTKNVEKIICVEIVYKTLQWKQNLFLIKLIWGCAPSFSGPRGILLPWSKLVSVIELYHAKKKQNMKSTINTKI